MNQRYFVSPEECFRQEIFPGVNIRTASSEQMTMSLVTFEPRAVVERHAHPHEQNGMIVRGAAKFEIGSESRRLKAGDMYFIPGGIEHRVTAEEEGCQALDVFHPAREDYR